MNRVKRKALAVLLAACTAAASFAPSLALPAAADTATESFTTYSNVTDAATLQADLTAAEQSGGEVDLGGDISSALNVSVAPQKTVILDGNGYTISSGTGSAFTVAGAGTLVLQNITFSASAAALTVGALSGTVVAVGNVVAQSAGSSGIVVSDAGFTGSVNITEADAGVQSSGGIYGLAFYQGTGTVSLGTAKGSSSAGSTVSQNTGVFLGAQGVVNVGTATGGPTADRNGSNTSISAGVYCTAGTVNAGTATTSSNSYLDQSYGVYCAGSGTVNVDHSSGLNGDAYAASGTINTGDASPVSGGTTASIHTSAVASLDLSDGSAFNIIPALGSLTVAADGATDVGSLPAVYDPELREVGGWYIDSARATAEPASATPGTAYCGFVVGQPSASAGGFSIAVPIPTPSDASFAVTGPNGYSQTFADSLETGSVAVSSLAPGGTYTVKAEAGGTYSGPETGNPGHFLASPASVTLPGASGLMLGTPQYSGSSFTLPNATASGIAQTVSVSITDGTLAEGSTPAGWTAHTDINTGKHTSYIFTASGSASVEDVLRSLTFTPASGAKSGDCKITVTLDSNTTNLPDGATFTAGIGENAGHYYMHVPDDGIDWLPAYNAAKGFYFMGMRGYLATVTNTAENQLLTSINSQPAWGGGTRLLKSSAVINDDGSLNIGDDTNGHGYSGTLGDFTLDDHSNADYWYWADGPEAGQKFYSKAETSENGTALPVTVDGHQIDYPQPWAGGSTGEPNDGGVTYPASSGTEQCLELNDINSNCDASVGGLWNDLSNKSSQSGDYEVHGYFVEFSNYLGGFSDDYSAANTLTRTFPVLTAPAASVNGHTGEGAVSIDVPSTGTTSFGLLDANGNPVDLTGATATDGSGSSLSFDTNGWLDVPGTAAGPVTITGLIPGAAYKVVAASPSDAQSTTPQAFHSAGTEDFINGTGAVAVPAVSDSLPAADTVLGNATAAITGGKASITVNPADTNSQYALLDGAGNTVVADWQAPSNGKVVFDNLNPDATYQVVAKTSGASTSETAATPSEVTVKTPDASFVNVSAGNVNRAADGTITVANTVSTQEYGVVDAATGKLVGTAKAGNGGTLTFGGLDAGKDYEVVTWKGGALSGTPLDVPAPGAAVGNISGGILYNGTDAGQGEITVPNSDSSKTYIVTDSSDNTVVGVQPGNGGTLTFEPLPVGRTYNVYSADNGASNIPAKGDTLTGTYGFSAPTSVAIPTVAISADAAASNAYVKPGATAGKYDIVVKPAAGNVTYVLTDAAGKILDFQKTGSGQVTFAGLDPTTTYEVYAVPADSSDTLTAGSPISGFSDAGNSPSTVTTPANGLTPVPAGSIGASTTSITVNPTGTSYRYALIDPATGATVASWQPGTGVTITFTGLQSGKQYEVAVIGADDNSATTLPLLTAATTLSGSRGGGSSGGSTGGSTATPAPVTVSGTSSTDSSGNTTVSATIPASDTNTTTVSTVTVNIGNVSVTGTSAQFGSLLTSNSDWLKLWQASTATATQTAANTAVTSAVKGGTVLDILDVNLTLYHSDGSSEQLHQISNNLAVTIKLTAEQLAKITDASTAKLYYFDPSTNQLKDMDATFDLKAGTATFNTDHFSTFLIVDSGSPVGVTYAMHVQHIGWQSFVLNGAEAGTTGQSRRAEAVEIKLTGSVPAGASIRYQAHVQGKGWLSPAADGAIGGTAGESRRLEAVRITLSGLSDYEVQYRVHVQNIGWMDWQTTANGTDISKAAVAGTTGRKLRAEAIEIRLVKAA